jgi:phosphotriesterase-related protein
VFVEFDNFGKEMFIDKKDLTPTSGRFATDWERVTAIGELVDGGYENQLLISGDICLKTLLHAYGGWGYDHVLTHILPMLDEAGVSARSIRRMIVENPAAWLDFER